MAVIYNATLRTARMNLVKDAIDAAATAGTLEIGTTAMASVLAVLTLADPCGSVSGDVLTFDTDPPIEDPSANATGTAAEARVKDGDGTVVISGLTVGESSANIIIASTSITSGQLVQIVSATITHNTSGI